MIIMILLAGILGCVVEQTWLAPITLGDGGRFPEGLWKVEGIKRYIETEIPQVPPSPVAVGLCTVPLTDGLGIRTGSAGADGGRCCHRFLPPVSCVMLTLCACGTGVQPPRAKAISPWWRCHCHYDHGRYDAKTALGILCRLEGRDEGSDGSVLRTAERLGFFADTLAGDLVAGGDPRQLEGIAHPCWFVSNNNGSPRGEGRMVLRGSRLGAHGMVQAYLLRGLVDCIPPRAACSSISNPNRFALPV